MNWLNSQAFTLLGQHIIWSDMIGNILGLIENPHFKLSDVR